MQRPRDLGAFASLGSNPGVGLIVDRLSGECAEGVRPADLNNKAKQQNGLEQ
jgi:hypothetical protein